VSLEFRQNTPLKTLNTFGMDVYAAHYTELEQLEDLPALLANPAYRQGPVLWLGGGSNLLLTRDYPGLVVAVRLKGYQLLEQDEQAVIVEAAAGENWHQWVTTTLENGWFGLENLSLIPGTVGACPVQNIGAYGVEAKDCIHEVVCADLLHNGEQLVLSRTECAFAYRDSLFKQQGAGRYLVTAVRFRLSLTPSLKTGYGDIQRELESMGCWPTPSAMDVSHAVARIRTAKLPDPRKLGNAGSFFKNPLVSDAEADALQARYPTLPRYPSVPGYSKLAAGWLIDQCGFKGHRHNDAGVHTQQALVLVNHGHATGCEIQALAQTIQATVKARFGVQLEAEPIIL
jgi:UDP-N-acetylmuramate dehydrogenase